MYKFIYRNDIEDFYHKFILINQIFDKIFMCMEVYSFYI